jgi:hypothetical protein
MAVTGGHQRQGKGGGRCGGDPGKTAARKRPEPRFHQLRPRGYNRSRRRTCRLQQTGPMTDRPIPSSSTHRQGPSSSPDDPEATGNNYPWLLRLSRRWLNPDELIQGVPIQRARSQGLACSPALRPWGRKNPFSEFKPCSCTDVNEAMKIRVKNEPDQGAVARSSSRRSSRR